jgi:peptide/nickel transport system permease protein
LASDLGYLSYKPYAPLFPTVLIMATVWSLNMLADAIRDVAGQSGRILLSSVGRRQGSLGPTPSDNHKETARA